MKVLEAGSRLADDYEVVGVLGQGGMGIVYLAENLQLGNRCAIKTFLAESLKDKDARDNFRTEALLWVNLYPHVNILTARAVREYSNRLYVSMDYIAPGPSGGVTLADYLAMSTPPWNEPEILRLAIQFCYGMEHARQHGLGVHRDIKPANVLIGPKNTLKIADFGIALPSKHAQEADIGTVDIEIGVFGVFPGKRTPIAGTPGYMPPEVFQGAEPDVRSDVYCFGLILAQLACHSSEPPYFAQARQGAKFFESMLKAQKKAKLSLPRNSYRSVIAKCLDFDPDHRYAGFFELGEELRSIYRNKHSLDLLMRGGNEDDLENLSQRATSLAHLGKRDEAIVLFERILAMNPELPSALCNYGSLLAEQGRSDEALPLLQKAAVMEPNNATILANCGNVLKRLDRNEDALACYMQAIRVHPDHFGAWLGRANLEYELGDVDEAVTSIDRSLRIYPTSTTALNNKALIERSRGEHMEALIAWQQLRKLDDSSILPIAEAVIELVYLSRHEGADKVFNKILPEMDRSHERTDVINVIFDEALRAAKRGEYEVALDLYGRVLAIEPDDDESRYNRGTALLAADRVEEACIELAKVVNYRCRDKTKLYNLGVAYFAAERLEDASRTLRLALELDEDYADALYVLAAVENKRGNFDGAVKICRHYLAVPGLEPDSLKVINNLLSEIQSNL